MLSSDASSQLTTARTYKARCHNMTGHCQLVLSPHRRKEIRLNCVRDLSSFLEVQLSHVLATGVHKGHCILRGSSDFSYSSDENLSYYNQLSAENLIREK